MKILLFVAAAFGLAVPSFAQDTGTPDVEILKGLYPGKTFSPYAKRNFPSHVYWGDTHVHTGLSLDAGVFGNTLRPTDAYKLARGEEIKSSTGLPVKLARPLDWLVVTDHTDLMGIAPDIQAGTPNIMKSPKGKEWHEGYSEGGEAAGKAAFDLITNFSQMTLPEDLVRTVQPGVRRCTWESGRRLSRPPTYHSTTPAEIHGLHRLRVDLRPQGLQPAPQRHSCGTTETAPAWCSP